MSPIEAYVRFLGSYFYAEGYDREDIEQEARIAAYLAPAGLERMAARRRVLDLVKHAQREKRGRLVELEREVASRLDVLEEVVIRETLRDVLSMRMTDSEREALGRVVRGEPIGRNEPRLGAAIWRLRKRLKVD